MPNEVGFGFENVERQKADPEPLEGSSEASTAIPEPTNMGLRTRYSHRDGCACRACRIPLKPATFESKVKFLILTCAAGGLLSLALWAALASRV